MARRPTFAESAEKPRLLVCAFAEVPGPSAVGVRAEQLLLAFSLNLDVDALSLKGRNLTHIQRVGAARMLRVPVAEGRGQDGTVARNAFTERLGAFRRALTRQLENDQYDVVYAVDLFSAAAALPVIGRARLVVEASEVPSATWDTRHPVSARDKETRAEWEAAEKAALKAASLIVAPSRQVARVLSERSDPRHIRVFPRLVDTRLYEPPTVEIDLEDTRTVAFFGGREGGARTAVVQSALKLLGSRAPEARFLVVGTPGRGDASWPDMLQKRGLKERTVLVDVTSPHDVSHALTTADVVVVVGDAGGLAMPHRALEAMACGRAVVVAAPEVSCRDHIVGEQHAKIVAPDAPEQIADVVCALLDDTAERARIGKAAEKQAARFDLGVRMPELAAFLTEATGVTFDVKLPPLDEVTAPAPIARAVPASRVAPLARSPSTPPAEPSSVPMGLPMPSPTSSMSSLTATVAPPAQVTDSGPSASAVRPRPGVLLADVDDPFVPLTTTTPTAGARPQPLSELSLPDASAEALPSSSGDVVVGVTPGFLHDATIETGDLPRPVAAPTTSSASAPRPGVPPTLVPMSAVRGLAAESAEPGDVWAGDTMFDPSAVVPPPADAPPERVKRAMLNTDSGATVVASRPAEKTSRRRPSNPGARSVDLLTGEPSEVSRDDWAPDTIADASPIVAETRLPSAERAVITHPPKSFLVEHGVGDMTAEDDE